MTLKVFEVVSATMLAIVGGMYWGPWVALTRTMDELDSATFCTVLRRMIRNMAPVMTYLLPLALLSTLPVLVLSFSTHWATFALTLVALALLSVTVGVTMAVEVPIVTTLDVGAAGGLPENWTQLRDRWGSFHLLRIVPALLGLVVLLVAMVL